MNPTRRRALIAWVIVCFVWGTTYLAIRIALETLPPMLMAAFRWIIAGTIIAIALKVRGERLPAVRAWPALAVLGVLLLGFGNGGVVFAELTVPSGLTAVLVATVPFWMVAIEAGRRGGDRVSAVGIAGLIVGFGGILLLVWPEIRFDGAGRRFILGVAATQIAAIGWAIGSAYARWRGHNEARSENILVTAAFEMLFGGLALLTLGLVLGEWSKLMFSGRSLGALAYLIFFGAIGGFGAYAYALQHLPVATVSLYAYVNPVIAVVLGTLILDEPLTARVGVAAAIVLAGMFLVRRSETRMAEG